ncbi:YgfZ/GcvT domain-containing protein [Roseibium aquae]|uniref:CAF17-like 4Fe-4S cluster assembly/insertion protein YgfZ n=1 Tax=Roseibium aquae TaxID=1323746 RepID=UPI001FCB994F|nr:folate-binding protein [Roseibium aquae]
MNQPVFAVLDNRGLLHVSGEQAHSFLQNLVTCDVDQVAATGAGFGALLTPQGKIQFDFLVVKTAEGYLLDTPAPLVADLKKRLTFYKLRAKVALDDVTGSTQVVAVWRGKADGADGVHVIEDPRFEALGQRLYGPAETIEALLAQGGAKDAGIEGYERHRIGYGVPQSVADFGMGEIFPHDADMDDLNGVSFTKGCYVGQEVVSRVHHRGTARKRFVSVTSKTPLPDPGTAIETGGKAIGALGSSTRTGDGFKGLALLRLDKAGAALEKGASITCGQESVAIELPGWARFGWPAQETAAD